MDLLFFLFFHHIFNCSLHHHFHLFYFLWRIDLSRSCKNTWQTMWYIIVVIVTITSINFVLAISLNIFLFCNLCIWSFVLFYFLDDDVCTIVIFSSSTKVDETTNKPPTNQPTMTIKLGEIAFECKLHIYNLNKVGNMVF